VYTQHSQNQEIKQKYFTTRQALHREKRGIKKPKEKLLKNNFQKLLAPSLSLPLSFFLLYPSSSVAGALY